jgi:hypothetical protein
MAAPRILFAAMILLCSELGPAGGSDAAGLARLAADAGYQGIAISPGRLWGELGSIAAAAASARLSVPVLAAPLGESPPGRDRRLPFLATADPEERLAAAALVAGTLARAEAVGATHALLELGTVELGVAGETVVRAFARRELGENDPAAAFWVAALRERRGRSPAILDACRRGLDRVLGPADRAGITLVVAPGLDPWTPPSPREAELLLAEYRGAPLGLVWDDAAPDVMAALGVAPPAARLAALAEGSCLRLAREAVGIEPTYLPGQGDPSGGASAPPLPALRHVMVGGRRGSSAREIGRARELVAAGAGAGTGTGTEA